MKSYRFCFVIENTLGHTTHYRNLRAAAEADPEIEARWLLLEFSPKGRLWQLPLVRSNWSLRASSQALLSLRPLLWDFKPQALFFHTQVAGLLAVPMLPHLPSVISMDCTPINFDSVGEQYGHSGKKPTDKLAYQLNRLALKRAKRINIWNEWTRQSLLADYGVRPSQLFKSPNGINLAAWPIPSFEKPTKLPRILFVGGDFKRKGGELLLKVWREHFQAQAELHILPNPGGLAAEPNLFLHERLENGSPEFLDLLYNSAIFAMPTEADVQPFAILEAMAAGLAIITGRVGAIAEQIEDGQNGYLVEPGNAEELRSCLEELIKNPVKRISLGQNARQRVEKHFDANTNAQQLFEVMKSLT